LEVVSKLVVSISWTLRFGRYSLDGTLPRKASPSRHGSKANVHPKSQYPAAVRRACKVGCNAAACRPEHEQKHLAQPCKTEELPVVNCVKASLL
jgi:hypothetical protein